MATSTLSNFLGTDFTGFTGSQGPIGFTGSQGGTGFTGSGGGSGGNPWIYKTENYTSVTNDRIIADTSGGSITIILPATPVINDMVTILDAGNAAQTPIIIDRNGNTIEDSADNFAIDVQNVKVDFIYDGTTWQVASSVGRRGETGFTGSKGIDGSFAGLGYTGSQGTIGFTGSRGTTPVVDVLAPTPAASGDLWFNTDEDQLKIYVDNQWTNSTPMYIPTGGITNQILAKSSNTNYDFAWVSSVTETVYALAGTQISLANGSIQYKTQTTNTTYTETLTSGQSVTLLINSGGFTTTWPTISWVGGMAPTIALTGFSVIVLFKINSTLYGKHSGDVV